MIFITKQILSFYNSYFFMDSVRQWFKETHISFLSFENFYLSIIKKINSVFESNFKKRYNIFNT